MSRLALAALLALIASPALAGTDTFGTPSRASSPRWGTVDVGAEGYLPNIDAEFPAGTVGPYEQMYGTGRGWMFRFDISRALYTKVGSLELGIRTGYFQKSAKAFEVGTTTRSGVDTAIRIIPSSLSLSYRYDDLADRWRVPLAPYGRATLERYNWWVTNGSGGTAQRGATMGWSLTGGLGFLLDFLDPMLARELDHDSGVNHTYLYFEVTKSWIDDFGSSTSWDLSDKDLAYGLGLMFVF